MVFTPEREEDVIRPAVDGTLAVLRACATNKVKRCVITSSTAAVVYTSLEDRPDVETGFFDETCWTDPENAYASPS